MAIHQSSLDPPIPAAVDRGPARYFHGRKHVRRDFEGLLGRASDTDTGTTFLIQGAPGIGKSALLYECERHARSRKWKVADIGVDALWDSHKLLDSLGLGDKYEVTEKSTQFGLKDFFSRGYKSIQPQSTVKNILEDGKHPLLLILDEAQVLGDKDVPPSEYKATTIHVLDLIHNGKLGRPVVLLAAGLNETRDAFGKLKISRFGQNCLVQLGALSRESERAVIRDWLEKEGGAKEDPTAWIEAIAQKTYGWPHHVLSYVYPAANQLKADGGIMTANGLKAVLKAGEKGRLAYYQERVVRFRGDQIRCLARSIADVPQGKPAEYKDILSSLKKEYGRSTAEKLFQRFERKGILEESGAGFAVPIPSMHTWLKEEYANK
ncbi:MAG: hypothetical protein OXH03_05325 [Bacteroidetes bacterium]|nr:hypothetical protein [Bacteroidota bacterium]MDE2672544.1 hypothetical protein [Bacteroidota bacterium]